LAGFVSAELAFLSGMKPLELQTVLRQLQTSNMLVLSSIPRGASFESKYELLDLAREYLLRNHPLNPEEVQTLSKREQELVRVSEQLTAQHRANPYSAYTVKIRSSSDLIVAKYLYDALFATRRKDFSAATDSITEARRLAPEYFEVHRVEAWMRVEMRDFSGARNAYEAALELEPQYAPLRLWYGGFLLRAVNKIEEALEQFRVGVGLDPKSMDLQREIASAHLYLREFTAGRKVVDELLSRDDLPEWNRRKVYDLHLQYFQRLAEHQVTQQEYNGALKTLRLLKSAYSQCPGDLLDSHMQTKLKFAISAARACTRYLYEEGAKAEARELAEWLASESMQHFAGFALPAYNAILRRGVIRELHRDKGFGFISEGKTSVFFHRSELRDEAAWHQLHEGQSVAFEHGTDQRGRPKAVRVAPLLTDGPSEAQLSEA
jgi:cold shock CspA family protein